MLPTAYWFVIIFTIQLLSTSMMTGIAWFVQIVHYPLFSSIPLDALGDYVKAHQIKVSRLVLPLMIAELLTGIWLAIWSFRNLSFWLFFLCLILLIVIWVFTLHVVIPLQKKLAQDPHPEDVHHLVHIHWVRTWAWSFRFFLLLGFIAYGTTVHFLVYLFGEI